MKKLFLFIGVILTCLFFSCKKNSGPPQSVIDSLSIPLKVGTWWKYQRDDSASGSDANRTICCSLLSFDSSIELITVIRKALYIDTTYDNKNSIISYDKVNAFMLDVKNLTKGTVDTNYVFYNNDSFKIKGKTYSYAIKVPIVEGTQYNWAANDFSETRITKNDTSVFVLNKKYNNCIFYGDYTSVGIPDSKNTYKSILFNSEVGFVYWKIGKSICNHYNGCNEIWYDRKLIEYHIAP